MKKIMGVIIGLLLIACGTVYILGAFGIADISFSFDGWWAFFIIIPCLGGIFSSKDKFGNAIGLLLGILLFLAARNVFEYKMIWKIIIPAIIVLLGIKIIIKSISSQKIKEKSEPQKADDEHMAFCCEKKIDFDNEIRVAKIGAVFGGTKCNLTNAKIKDGSQIDLMCAFGGADIILPENVDIKINAFCLFGGISDKRAVKPSSCERVTLNINGFCLFGGADIK